MTSGEPTAVRIANGTDCFAEQRGLGISIVTFKTISSELLVLENIFHAKGGPPRHLHFYQEEWFYALEGDFVFEVGTERFTLHPGDSLLAPRQVPHVWAHVGPVQGRILITFQPAGDMEAFFREATQSNAMPQDSDLFRRHGMNLLGPPLTVE